MPLNQPSTKALWSSQYRRLDRRRLTVGRTGAERASIAARIPASGWLVASPDGLNVMGRAITGIAGRHKTTVPNERLTSVVGHKRGKKWETVITFIDGSSVTVLTKTRRSSSAIRRWAEATDQFTPVMAAA